MAGLSVCEVKKAATTGNNDGETATMGLGKEDGRWLRRPLKKIWRACLALARALKRNWLEWAAG